MFSYNLDLLINDIIYKVHRDNNIVTLIFFITHRIQYFNMSLRIH